VEITIVESTTNLSNQVQGHYTKIATAWHKTIEGVLDASSELLKAKQSLSSADWKNLVTTLATNKVMSSSTTRKLIAIAETKVFQNPDIQKFLPSSYATLYEMKDIKEDIIIEKINNGELTSSIQRNQLSSVFGAKKPQKDVFKDIQKLSISIKGSKQDLSDDSFKELKELLEKISSLGLEVKGI